MYLVRKRAELFHRRYIALDGFEDASKLQTNVLNALERSASFSVEQLKRTLIQLCLFFLQKKF